MNVSLSERLNGAQQLWWCPIGRLVDESVLQRRHCNLDQRTFFSCYIWRRQNLEICITLVMRLVHFGPCRLARKAWSLPVDQKTGKPRLRRFRTVSLWDTWEQPMWENLIINRRLSLKQYNSQHNNANSRTCQWILPGGLERPWLRKPKDETFPKAR